MIKFHFFLLFQLQRSNNINSDRCKKVSTTSIGSYSSDLSPFISLMGKGRKVSSSESISHSTLSLKRSASVEGFVRRMEKVPDAWRRSQLQDDQQVHLMMTPGVTARPPMILLTPRCDRKVGNTGGSNSNAELMAAHRRRKMRRRQVLDIGQSTLHLVNYFDFNSRQSCRRAASKCSRIISWPLVRGGGAEMPTQTLPLQLHQQPTLTTSSRTAAMATTS